MNHNKNSKAYDDRANELENDKLDEYLQKWDLKDYLYCETFKYFDITIINNLIQSLMLGSEEYSWFKEVISVRKTKH